MCVNNNTKKKKPKINKWIIEIEGNEKITKKKQETKTKLIQKNNKEDKYRANYKTKQKIEVFV